MTTKVPLLVAVLTLSILTNTLQAVPRRCACIRTYSTPIRVRYIKKIEGFPISGHCRRTEIIITRNDSTKICVDPQAKWVRDLLEGLKSRKRVAATSRSSAGAGGPADN